jgi:hypothetical protein
MHFIALDRIVSNFMASLTTPRCICTKLASHTSPHPGLQVKTQSMADVLGMEYLTDDFGIGS